MENKEITIIGGGLSGLIAGYELSTKGYLVKIIEMDQDLGGLASSYQIYGQSIPKAYHHVMKGDTVTLDVIKRLNLINDLYWTKLKSGIFINGRIHNFSTPLNILNYEPLSFLDRIRFGLLVFKAQRRKEWDDIERMSVKDWVIKEAGQGVYENFIKNLVINKFGISPENISAAWLSSRVGHESKSIGGLFGYLKGGISRLIESMKEKIELNNGTILTNTPVEKLVVKGNRVTSIQYNGKSHEVDMVLSTLPIPALLKITTGLPESYAESLSKIRYKASICVTYGLDSKISEYYWLNVFDNFPFKVIFEHDHLNKELKTPGVVYVCEYTDISNDYWKMSDHDTVDAYSKQLDKIISDFSNKVIWSRVFKAPYSTPVYDLEYSLHKPSTISPVNGLYIAGISQVYPRDRYMGTAMETGIRAAERILDTKKKNPT